MRQTTKFSMAIPFTHCSQHIIIIIIIIIITIITLTFLKELGIRIASLTGEERSHFYLIQRVSVAIQRGNGASIMGTTGHLKSLDELLE